MSRCIFCGYCELACPFDAITLGNEFEISEYSRDDLIYTKDMLLGRADQARAGRRPRPLRHADPVLQGPLVIVASAATSSSGSVWVVAAFACLGSGDRGRHLLEPVLLGARADREPRLARRALPAALGRVRRRRAGARLRRRGDGDVPVRDRLPRRRADAPWAGGPSWQAVGAVARRGRAPGRDHRRDRPEGRRTPLGRGRHHARASAARPRSGGCSSPTTCSRSRSPRSCCSSPRSAASSSAATRAHDRPEATPRDDGARTSPGTSCVAAFLFATGALGVLHPAQPADRPALARDHAQRREPRPDRVRAPLRRAATARSSRSR